jgi:hypothetical protein
MSIRRFRRHAPPCFDGAIHHIFDTLTARPALRGAFTRLLTVAHARSALLRDLPPSPSGRYVQLEALRTLAGYHRGFLADPFAWSGAPGRHPLGIIDSLARHLLGRYPTPRFLASVWFTGDGDLQCPRRHWYIAHSRGRPFRRLRLPIAMNRRMEHVFLRSPDHLSVEVALRRAEVIGLGGSPALADAITASRLGSQFDRPDLWRGVIAWLIARGDEVDVSWVKAIIDHVQSATTPVRLAGRTFEDVRREADARPAPLQPVPAARRGRDPRRPPVVHSWARSPWSPATFAGVGGPWRVVELTDSTQLVREGGALEHCVGRYGWRCASGVSRIWSLRRIIGGIDTSVLTIEIDPKTGTIVQLRGRRNARAAGEPLALVRRWAAGERLRISDAVEAEIAVAAAGAAAPSAGATAGAAVGNA